MAIDLEFEATRVVVDPVGAALASCTVRGRDLVVPFDPAGLRPVYRGALLAPWPNRIVDGRYSFAGQQHQLPLTEPERGHALHGLVAWQKFDVVESAGNRIGLATEIVPQTGYPWALQLRVEYLLGEHGIRQSVTATNLSATPAPYGVAAHHYLVAGSGDLNDWTLELSADRVMQAEGERLLPGPVAAVDAGSFDFRAARTLGDVQIDHAFAAGGGYAEVLDAQGVGTRMDWDAGCSWVQVHTADRPEPELNRAGLAVEPMTCAPDAFNSGEGLLTLQPGQECTVSWSLAAVG